MSETVHYKGKLKPTGKGINAYIKGHQIPKYYESNQEYFEDHLCDHAVFFEGQVYEIDMTEYEDHDDIFESSKNEDGTIDFQVKYYNGGCGFSEAIEEALRKA